MDKTQFAGLTRLAPEDSLSDDNYSFQEKNPEIIDYLLRLAVRDHRHDGHAALGNPTADPVLGVLGTGGTIPADISVSVGYTLIDAQGGETALNTTPGVITTQAGLLTPTDAPTLVASTAAGTLLAGSYTYAVTITDGLGGETELGPTRTVVIPAGSATNEITISGLDALMAASGGAGWRLWRSVNGGVWALLNDGATASMVDDGSMCSDSGVEPPEATTGTTNATNRLQVTIPSPQDGAAVTFRIYASIDGLFSSPALLGEYPVADLGSVKTYTALAPLDGAPPEVSLAMPGASQILAADIGGLRWKAPVADAAALAALTDHTAGDIRLQLSDMTLHGYNGTAWVAVGGGGGGGGGTGDKITWTSADTSHSMTVTHGYGDGGPGAGGLDHFASDLIHTPDYYTFTTGAAELTVTGGALTVNGVTAPKEALAPVFGKMYGDFMVSMKISDADPANFGEVRLGVKTSSGAQMEMREATGRSGIELNGWDEGGVQRISSFQGSGTANPPTGDFWMVLRRVGMILSAERWLVDPRGVGGAADKIKTVDVSALGSHAFRPEVSGAITLWFKLTPTTTGAVTYDDLGITGNMAADAIVATLTDLESGNSTSKVLLDEFGNSGLTEISAWKPGTLQGTWGASAAPYSTPAARMVAVGTKRRIELMGAIVGGAVGAAWQIPNIAIDGASQGNSPAERKFYSYGTAKLTVRTDGKVYVDSIGSETDISLDGIFFWQGE